MDSDRWEVALAKQLVQLSSPDSALDEDDNLVELEIVEEFVQLAVLLLLFKLDVVLLETVQSELGVLVNVVLRGVLHEFAADGLDMLRQCRGEHHNLLLRGSSTEDVLNISAHVCHR